MKKNVVQDVVPKKSIRNVTISSKKELPKIPKIKEEKIEEIDEFQRKVPIQMPIKIEAPQPKIEEPKISEFPPYNYEFTEKKTSSKKWFYLSIVVLILIISFGISSLFKSATIKISPKQENKEINENLTAKKDDVVNLGFQTVSVNKEVEKTVKSTGEEKVERKSQGKIVIYNNYNNQPQKLVATTRFQTPEGLIFRLTAPATIPPREIKDGKSVPGSVEVTVEADKPGVSYNIGLKDFTIPGFKGDPRFTSIYARSKTEMTGGFSGMQKIVSKDVLTNVENEMNESLKSALSNDVNAQIPSNFISFSDGLYYDFGQITQIPAVSSDEVILKKKGKATAVIFDKSFLTKSIVSKVMPSIEVDSVRIQNLNELKFKLNNPLNETDKEIYFNLSGNANFVWVIDQNKLKEDLLGLSKKSAKTIIGNYASINEAWIETKPFWNQNIPNNPKKVTLTNTVENL